MLKPIMDQGRAMQVDVVEVEVVEGEEVVVRGWVNVREREAMMARRMVRMDIVCYCWNRIDAEGREELDFLESSLWWKRGS